MKREADCGYKDKDCWFRYRAAAIIVEEGYVLFAANERDDYYYSVGGGVHVHETSEEAVIREVYEETGENYEVDRLAVIHENLFEGKNGKISGLHCHEISFYYLMKPKGLKQLEGKSYTSGWKESMHWLPIDRLHEYKVYPHFMERFLQEMPDGILHIVTDERRTSWEDLQNKENS